MVEDVTLCLQNNVQQYIDAFIWYFSWIIFQHSPKLMGKFVFNLALEL